MDILEAVKVIQESSLMNLSSDFIRRIHYFLTNIGLWDLKHIFSDYNKIANCMTKMTFDTNHSLNVFKMTLLDVFIIF